MSVATALRINIRYSRGKEFKDLNFKAKKILRVNKLNHLPEVTEPVVSINYFEPELSFSETRPRVLDKNCVGY